MDIVREDVSGQGGGREGDDGLALRLGSYESGGVFERERGVG